MEIACDIILESAVKLRNDAKRLAEEKEVLLKHIDQVRQSVNSCNLSKAQHDDALCQVDRAQQLSETVDVTVCNMARDSIQSDARRKVNILLEKLEVVISSDPRSARARLVSYLNACHSTQVGPGIAPDQEFERCLVGCTLDDQKEAKIRIQMLMERYGIGL